MNAPATHLHLACGPPIVGLLQGFVGAGAGVSTVGRYQKRLSGPLLDRSAKPHGGIDTPGDVEVPRVDYEKLSDCEAS